MPRNNTCIYTAVYGDYDQPVEARLSVPGVDFVIFSNNDSLECKGWQLRLSDHDFGSPRLNAKVVKICPHIFLPEYDFTFWIDANYEILDDGLIDLFRPQLQNGMVALDAWSKDSRDCAYMEAEAVLGRRRYDEKAVREQVQYYREQGLPEHYGLYGCAMLFRHNRNLNMRQIADAWWQEQVLRTSRDQISLPFVLFKLGLEIGTVSRFDWKNKVKINDHLFLDGAPARNNSGESDYRRPVGGYRYG